MAKLVHQSIVKITVHGRGVFPLDMLRHDRAVPYSSEDVSRIIDYKSKREVTLLVYDRVTEARWRSFGWNVVKSEYTQP